MTEEEQKAPEGEEKPEEAKEEEAGKETPAEPIKDKVEEAKETLEEIKKVRDETKELVERAETLKANEILGGESEAGEERPKALTEEEQKDEELYKAVEATGLRFRD